MRCKRRLVVAALGCLAAAAFVLNTVHFQGSLSRADVTLQPTTVAEQEPTQDAIEAAALAEAIAAPRIGPDGEDRSAPAPREASGAGRRDDIHVRPAPALPPELPSDPELPEEDEFSAAHPSRQAARPVVIGGCDDGDEFTEPLVTKAAFEAAWGGCHRSGWRPVLVALPYSADMLCDLQVLMFTNLKSLECANEGFNLHLGLYDKPYQNDMDARKTKKSGRGVLATLRNALLQEYLRPEHEYVLWLDADVVEYPPDLVGQLHGLNPGGVSAPLVLIEDSDTERFHKHLCHHPLCHMGMQKATREIKQWSDKRYHQFYDRAAFIASNTNISHNRAFPGNSLPFPPYLGGVEGWTAALASGAVACESVGTVYMLPGAVYRDTSVASSPHGPHFPTAFTEHFPVVHAAKYELGVPIRTATHVVALHANLPKYHLQWHKEPMKGIWDAWLQPYLGKSLADPALRTTEPPTFWVDDAR